MQKGFISVGLVVEAIYIFRAFASSYLSE